MKDLATDPEPDRLDPTPGPAPPGSPPWPWWAGPLLVALVTLVVFLPTLGGGFVDWDDDQNFLMNLAYRGLGWTHVRWMFTTPHMGHYTPVTWLTLGLDYLLWGMAPLGYHLTNVLFHAAAAAALCLLVQRLLGGGAAVGAVAAALLFALHPMRVESVAWVTERRDVVSGLAYVLTVLAYLRAAGAPDPVRRRRWYWGAVGVFGLGVLAKGIVITLPVVLVALDVYPLRRLGGARGWLGAEARRVWLEKLPFGVLALGGAVAAMLAGITVQAAMPIDALGVPSRLAIATYGVGFYLWKTLLPVALSPLYPIPDRLGDLTPGIVLGGTLLVGLTAAGLVLRRRLPGLLVAWIAYVVTLAPVSGLVQSGPQLVADRYTYLPNLGWTVLAGAGIEWCWRRCRRGGAAASRLAVAGLGLTAIALPLLAGLTLRQIPIWHDSEVLWSRAVTVSPSAYAYANYGAVLARQGRMDEAMSLYRRALALDPRDARANYNVGVALLREDRRAEAIAAFRRALASDDTLALAHQNLGAALVEEGQLDEAIVHLREAIHLQPDLALAHFNLGRALERRGALDEARAEFETAVRFRPDHELMRQALAAARARAATRVPAAPPSRP